jgi:hypothetical protein
VSDPAADLLAYREGLQRLAAAVRRGIGTEGKAERFKARRGELNSLAADLRALAWRVQDGPAWLDLESQLEAADKDQLSGAQQLQRLNGAMLEAAEAAEAAAGSYKDPRTLPVLPWAALVFLHLRQRHGVVLPTNYVGHEGVVEFAGVLTDAKGSEVGCDRALTLLKAARAEFDPWMPPEGSDEVLDAR